MRRWPWTCAVAVAFAVVPASARADGFDALFPIMRVGELLIPDVGIVIDADSPNIALAFPVQVHLWQRAHTCSGGTCSYRPWLAALIEPRWASGGHGFAVLGGIRTYFPLQRRIGPGAPTLSVDVAAVGEGSGIGWAVGGGPSLEAKPVMQMMTPRYRFVWSAEPRHEIYFDLSSFGWGAKN